VEIDPYGERPDGRGKDGKTGRLKKREKGGGSKGVKKAKGPNPGVIGPRREVGTFKKSLFRRGAVRRVEARQRQPGGERKG